MVKKEKLINIKLEQGQGQGQEKTHYYRLAISDPEINAVSHTDKFEDLSVGLLRMLKLYEAEHYEDPRVVDRKYALDLDESVELNSNQKETLGTIVHFYNLIIFPLAKRIATNV